MFKFLVAHFKQKQNFCKTWYNWELLLVVVQLGELVILWSVKYSISSGNDSTIATYGW